MSAITYTIISLHSHVRAGGSNRAELLIRSYVAHLFGDTLEDTQAYLQHTISEDNVVTFTTTDKHTAATLYHTKAQLIEHLKYLGRRRQVSGFMVHPFSFK